jgi:hypothetical protein
MKHVALETPLRRSLEKTIGKAREIAETAVSAAIKRLGVEAEKAPTYLDETSKDLRRRLRAHARALGDKLDATTDRQAVKKLVEGAAYVHWHRMLFARFLAERGMLRHPEFQVPVSLSECEELAPELGLTDAWAVSERFAAIMLPGVFRPDDPVLELELAPENNQAMQALVNGLDLAVFMASDSLGWTYQFWRAAEKKAVNESGKKIGADELPAVTQLFTEPYMVRFLLHNTLGAWWAGKVLAEQPTLAETAPDEATLREACGLPGVEWDMLRFVREEGQEDGRWRPAAGTFEGWPTEAKALTVLDPCCGSGHFLTEALPILVALRQAEEGLSVAQAVTGVLQDNLFGLEIDGRCVQIAAFAVALTAWQVGGYQNLPNPHIAWVGAPPPMERAAFMALANGDERLRYHLQTLFDVFQKAPVLGSLLDPKTGGLEIPYQDQTWEQIFDSLVAKLRNAEPEQQEGAIAARGMADAAALLNRRYTLQVTNVPYLGRGKQGPALADFALKHYPDAKADLATMMLARMLKLTTVGGTVTSVTPQNWLFLGSYKKLRQDILANTALNVIGALGPRAFETISGEVVNTALVAFSNMAPNPESHFAGLDANDAKTPNDKAVTLATGEPKVLSQKGQEGNPDARIALDCNDIGKVLLSDYAISMRGIVSGDSERWTRNFWETIASYWIRIQFASTQDTLFYGLSYVINWKNNGKELLRPGTENEAYGKFGIAISRMRGLRSSLYLGNLYEQSTATIIPHNEDHLRAIYCFCSSQIYVNSVRNIDAKVNVTNATLLKVPFDLDHWQQVAAEQYPNGLPEPYSDDPTQWLFYGHPAQAEPGTALHVALARLCGYRWPAEGDTEMRLSTEARAWIAKAATLPAGDDDGILCLDSVAGERSLADRLRVYLSAAFGDEWSDDKERQLVSEADTRFEKKPVKDASLEAWLADRAFAQHCTLFHQRPFLWQVWDGAKGGFSAFLHYHRFTKGTLEKLTYTTLGDWLSRAKAEDNTMRQEKGRELQQVLEAILKGEPPYDIFVRWKSLERLPLGWDPDLDDGVRMNIRPFVNAGILRATPNIKWGKDRGTDVQSAPWYKKFEGERINDHHTTLDEKRQARAVVTKRLEAVQ